MKTSPPNVSISSRSSSPASRRVGPIIEGEVGSYVPGRNAEAFRKAGIRYTMHWSKNSGIDPDKLEYMYGATKIASWKAARRAVFGNDQSLMQLFETDAMIEAGLA